MEGWDRRYSMLPHILDVLERGFLITDHIKSVNFSQGRVGSKKVLATLYILLNLDFNSRVVSTEGSRIHNPISIMVTVFVLKELIEIPVGNKKGRESRQILSECFRQNAFIRSTIKLSDSSDSWLTKRIIPFPFGWTVGQAQPNCWRS